MIDHVDRVIGEMKLFSHERKNSCSFFHEKNKKKTWLNEQDTQLLFLKRQEQTI